MNDKDVIISKGKESLKGLHSNALALLDLTHIFQENTFTKIKQLQAVLTL